MSHEAADARLTSMSSASEPEEPQMHEHGSGELHGSAFDVIRSPLRAKAIGGKSMSLLETTRLLCVGDDAQGVLGFDPRRWILSSGVLEKRRDGRMREGWAKRFFVLNEEFLFYYLLPRDTHFGSLLGDERGQIRLTSIESVDFVPVEDDQFLMTLSVGELRKATASGLLSAPVTELTLRMKGTELARKWRDAIVSARDVANAKLEAYVKIHGGPPPVSKSVFDRPFQRFRTSSSKQKSGPPTPTSTAFAKKPLKKSKPSSERSTENPVKARLKAEYGVEPRAYYPSVASLVVLTALAIGWTKVLSDPKSFSVVSAPLASTVAAISVVLCVVAAWGIGYANAFSTDAIVRDFSKAVDALSVAPPRRNSSGGHDDDFMMGDCVEECGPHRAGATIVPTATEEEERAGDPPRWFPARGENFNVRIGPNYKKNHKKAPSDDPLYELVAMDLVKCESARPYRLISDHSVDMAHLRGVDIPNLEKSGFPRFIIVNVLVPDKSGNIFGSKNADDLGSSLVFYFRVRPELVEEFLSDECRPSVKLLQKFTTTWSTDEDVRRRLKAIGMASNISEIGVPSVMAKTVQTYNGKPVICYKVVEIEQNKQEYLELDLSIHEFPFAARKALQMIRSRTADAKLRVAFVIQSEADDELPEVVFGAAEIRNLDFRNAATLPEL